MKSFQAFEAHLQEALSHLYDPAYRPAEEMWAVMGCDLRQGQEALQTALVWEIESLKPTPNVPPSARIRRIYGLLSCIYVQGLTQEEAAERLNITPRHLRRERPEAVHALAMRIWERYQTENVVDETLEELAPADQPQAPAWRSLVRQELASLQESAPHTVVDVAKTIRSTADLVRALTTKHGIALHIASLPSNLIAKMHPSVLRQVFIAAIGELVHHMETGQIGLSATRQERGVHIAITGQPVLTHGPLNSELLQEIIAAQGGSVQISTDGDQISFAIELASASQTVLVVDDNQDMAHLYRRYTAGTWYHIVHVAEGKRVLEAVETSRPNIILLDIMLPDVDGWELLTHLREHPATQSIPIMVCSVVREEELALALGADLYLSKPVQRQQFLESLDQLLNRA